MLNFAKDFAAALDALRRHAILFLLGVTIVALALLGRSWLDAHDAGLRLQATLAAQQKTITDAEQRQTTRDTQLTQTLTQITAAKQKVQTPIQAANALPQAVSQLIATGPSGHPLPSPITIELPPANGSSNSVSARNDLENREGTVTSQKGSSAPQSASSVLTNIAEQAKSASNAQANSPSPSANANSNGNLPPRDGTSAQNNSAPPPAIIRVPQEDLKPLYDAVEDCQICHAKLTAAQADLTDEKSKFAAATAQRDAAIRAARGTFWKRTRTAAKWIIIGAAAGAVLSRYH
jgi:hypothetical protein